MLGRREFFKAAAAAVLFRGTETVAKASPPVSLPATASAATAVTGQKLFRLEGIQFKAITWLEQKVGDKIFCLNPSRELQTWIVKGPHETWGDGPEPLRYVSTKEQTFYHAAPEDSMLTYDKYSGAVRAVSPEGNVQELKPWLISDLCGKTSAGTNMAK